MAEMETRNVNELLQIRRDKLAALQQAGVTVYGGTQGPADDVVEAFLAGSLQQTASASCHAHDHEGSCGNGGCCH